MSKVATDKRNWLDEVKADAEKLTKRRLEDDGFESHVEKENAINADERKFDGSLKDLSATHGTGATDPTKGGEVVDHEGEQAKVGAPKTAKK